MEATKEKHATHTPGPWYAYHTHKDVHRQIACKDGNLIAKEVHHANARLIAAAPEMYEMLRDLSKVVKNLESIGASLPYYFKDDMSMSDKLREVLAKVEGGEG